MRVWSTDISVIRFIWVLKPNGYHLVHQEKLFPYGICALVPYDSHKKQRLFPETELTGWALLWRSTVSCEV
jgi:hypothetical protein